MNINEIEKEIERLQNLLIEEKNKYKLSRIPNEKYYYINNKRFCDGFGISNTNDDCDDFDNANYNQYNYFTDENKAKQYAEHIKLELELLRIRDIINDGWKPNWSSRNENKKKYYIFLDSDKILTDYVYTSVRPFAFETPEKRDKFIELVGKDKIIKYLSF